MLKIGHRGAAAYAPENTLTSFRRAVELGADGVEFDLHRARDGTFVVLHDDTVETLRIVVLDPATDAELYRSPADIPVRLGVG